MAASHDQRIQNKAAWGIGLESLPDATVARNVILTDDQVRGFVDAATARDVALGLFVHVLAETGARPSQAARLLIDDLHGGAKPKLSMPRSGKGGSKNRAARKTERVSVPITPGLAQRLKEAAKGRAHQEPLLLDRDGNPWGRDGRDPAQQYRYDIREIVTGLGLDPDEVTAYSLRHSSVVRQLLCHVPIRIIASTHDTSVAMIEKHYSKFIADHADDLSRSALLHHEEPASVADNVVPITGR
jgi:integrase